jgi:hypothetical protein
LGARNFYPNGDSEVDEDDNQDAQDASEFNFDTALIAQIRLRTQATKNESNSQTKPVQTMIAFLHSRLLLKKGGNHLAKCTCHCRTQFYSSDRNGQRLEMREVFERSAT